MVMAASATKDPEMAKKKKTKSSERKFEFYIQSIMRGYARICVHG